MTESVVRPRPLLLVVLVASGACGSATAPIGGAELMQTQLTVTPDILGPGDTARIRIVSTNTAAGPAEFTSCPTPLIELLTEDGGLLVQSDCLAPGTVRIEAGDSVTAERGFGTQLTPNSPLPAGRYLLRAGWAVEGALLAVSEPVPVVVSPLPATCTGVAVLPGLRVLAFTRTTGFRHASIPDGVAAVEAIGSRYQMVVEHTEDPADFDDANLGSFDVVVFLNTTGDVLGDAQQAAFERYIQAGGGFVGVHSATDTEYGWAWYGGLVGTYFASHPAIQQATVRIEDADHPSTRCLTDPWIRTDEWYDFQGQPSGVTVLATVDESTYQGGMMGAPHPIAWFHPYDGGRAWYTAMGHTSESYADPAFLDHLAGGILWAAQTPQ